MEPTMFCAPSPGAADRGPQGMTQCGSPGVTQGVQPGHEVPVYERLDLELVSGDGARVWDTEGREYLDLYGGHATALLGQNHPRLVDVLTRQARTLFFQTNLVELAVRRNAATRLAAYAPPGLERVFFVNSGAEANENALRIAFRLSGRRRAVAVEGSFHGRTAAAAAVTWRARPVATGTGSAVPGWYGFPTAPFEVSFVPADDCAALAHAIDEDVACVIFEAVQGQAGARPLSTEFLVTALERARACGALCIADEVQCGMGRTGLPFAIQRASAACDLVPELLTTAKGLAGGFPAGAVLTTVDLAARLAPGSLGTTFGGGPLACALIEAVLDTLMADDLPARARGFEAAVRAQCVVGPVTAVQGAGCLLGLRTTPPARAVLAALRRRGILAGGAADPHIVRLLPPLIVGAEEVARLAAALAEIAREECAA